MTLAVSLKQRLITAGLLAPVIMLCVVFLPTPVFALALAGVIGVGAWEWGRLVGVPESAGRAAHVLLVVAAMALLWFVVPPAWDIALLALGVLWWLGATATLALTRQIEPARGLQPALIPTALVVLVLPWLAMVRLHGLDLPPDGLAQAQGGGRAGQGPWLVLALMMLVWLADSAAYFAGRRWGRRKLAPMLSPGKTRAGVYAGLLAAALWGALVGGLMGLRPTALAAWVLLCAAVAALSVVGDLYESLLKRRRGLKDTGSLLPGHGGMLDRIDSFTSAAPLFVLGVLWLENV
ncbi:phosphatidate cytidylyltransferase [Thiohalocapsa marina]|uniref:Phosphatidate cytidylyltransferase n=1 Tax=Thiohalocapsa marina TaxID=424902 RepID=A0A5M8FNV4_9GAMM|nr:phosphatidate cytidylyltransferase [Thiohalocapsa marina]KAA6184801.1 phosphatidate cytidylyltransferase [Thiohalocapsa marina]